MLNMPILALKKDLYQVRLKYLIYIIAISFNINAQVISFKVAPANISSVGNDEFGPVFYKNSLVFCSNAVSSSPISVTSNSGKLFNLMQAKQKDSLSWRSPNLFSKELTTILNEGPATFNAEGTKVFYVRNTEVEGKLKKINRPSNKLGIFSAEWVDGKWGNIQPFPYNSEDYSLGTPFLSHNGKRIYFASDMPGGFGGNDLYYSEWANDQWQKPVNLGSSVNTKGNESYPYEDADGRLFFASDGHKGFGGKDIYYVMPQNKGWSALVHLDRGINSDADDYGLVTDRNFQYGAFSTNRGKSEDIYTFITEIPQFVDCSQQKENQRCFSFYDERYVDTLYLEYEWDFGNGVKKYGLRVDHCFEAGGKHEVTLNVIHHIADTNIVVSTDYNFEFVDAEQPYIAAPDIWVKGKNITLNGKQSNLPGMEIKGYVWNFAGEEVKRGIEQNYRFDKEGEYEVKLGLLGQKDSLGIIRKECVSKRIKIASDFHEAAMLLNPVSNLVNEGSVDTTGTYHLHMSNYVIGNFSAKEKHEIKNLLKSNNDKQLSLGSEGFLGETEKSMLVYQNIIERYPGTKLLVMFHTNLNKHAKKNLELTGDWAKTMESYLQMNLWPMDKYQCRAFGAEKLKQARAQGPVPTILRAEFIVYKE